MPATTTVSRPRLVLASASKQRLALLGSAGVDPVVCPADIDESPRADETGNALVQRLAVGKAMAVAERLAESGNRRDVIVAADTVAWMGSEASGKSKILGKPTDREHAEKMLAALSGREHEILTGLAVLWQGSLRCRVVASTVTFRPLDAETINWYLGTNEWCGRAAAYAIQEAGALLVASLVGSYQGVVGLPLVELDELLDGFGRPLRTWVAGG